MTTLHAACRVFTLLCAAAAGRVVIAAPSTDEQIHVYRCPGPPVVYTTEITSAEARARGCTLVTGPITVAPTPSPTNAPLSRWLFAGVGASTNVFIDTQTLRKSGDRVLVWLKWNNSEPSETSRSYPKKTYLSQKTLSIYDCAERSYKTIQVLRYSEADAAGEVVEQSSVGEAAVAFAAVAPETLGEAILDRVCALPVSPR